jgi:hypothetical protein
VVKQIEIPESMAGEEVKLSEDRAVAVYPIWDGDIEYRYIVFHNPENPDPRYTVLVSVEGASALACLLARSMGTISA